MLWTTCARLQSRAEARPHIARRRHSTNKNIFMHVIEPYHEVSRSEDVFVVVFICKKSECWSSHDERYLRDGSGEHKISILIRKQKIASKQKHCESSGSHHQAFIQLINQLVKPAIEMKHGIHGPIKWMGWSACMLTSQVIHKQHCEPVRLSVSFVSCLAAAANCFCRLWESKWCGREEAWNTAVKTTSKQSATDKKTTTKMVIHDHEED